MIIHQSLHWEIFKYFDILRFTQSCDKVSTNSALFVQKWYIEIKSPHFLFESLRFEHLCFWYRFLLPKLYFWNTIIKFLDIFIIILEKSRLFWECFSEAFIQSNVKMHTFGLMRWHDAPWSHKFTDVWQFFSYSTNHSFWKHLSLKHESVVFSVPKEFTCCSQILIVLISKLNLICLILFISDNQRLLKYLIIGVLDVQHVFNGRDSLVIVLHGQLKILLGSQGKPTVHQPQTLRIIILHKLVQEHIPRRQHIKEQP